MNIHVRTTARPEPGRAPKISGGRLLAVHDRRRLIRESVSLMLASLPRKVVATDELSACMALGSSVPSLTVLLCGTRLDTMLPDLRELAREREVMHTLVVCDSDDRGSALRAIQAGACGYVSAVAGFGTLLKAIEAVEAGRTFSYPGWDEFVGGIPS